jgi:mRNA interferase MazF
MVCSIQRYNGKVGLAILCPITNQIKGYPFEVILPPDIGVTGAILSDQVKSLDWKARKAEFLGKLPTSVLVEVLKN